jgi:hypothetical protein
MKPVPAPQNARLKKLSEYGDQKEKYKKSDAENSISREKREHAPRHKKQSNAQNGQKIKQSNQS